MRFSRRKTTTGDLCSGLWSSVRNIAKQMTVIAKLARGCFSADDEKQPQAIFAPVFGHLFENIAKNDCESKDCPWMRFQPTKTTTGDLRSGLWSSVPEKSQSTNAEWK